MRSFWLSSLCVLMLACSASKKSQLVKTDMDQSSFKRYFDGTSTVTKYKTDVNLYGRNFSGILFFKFKNDTTCHVSMITVPGAKLFDMELTPKRDTIFDCLSQLDRDAVIKTIANNIRMFVMLDNFIDSPASYKENGFDGVVWKRNTHNEYYKYYQKEEGITKVELYTLKNKKKITLKAENFTNHHPGIVDLDNSNVNLKIHLEKLD